MLSPEHKMLLWCGHNQQEIGLAEEIVHKLRGLKKADNYHVKATFSYEGSSIDISDTMIRILVMISADGRVRYNENTNKTYVEMHFKKERKVSRCKQLLESENLSFKASAGKDGSTYIWFTLNGAISKSLCMFYGASKNQLAVVIDEIYREAYYNYRLNGGNSYYIKAIVEKYKSQYERQQNQKNIETVQHDALLNIISVALDGTKDTIAVSGGYGNKTLAEFGEQVDDICLLPIAEVVKGTELDYHNTTETKHKIFEEMSYEEKIKSVNKQIDDLLDFIERNKQAKYDKWRKETSI